MRDVPHRFIEHPDGRAVRATIVPRETPSGIDPDLHTIIFEAVGGEFIGSTPIFGWYSLQALTGEELREYFQRARTVNGQIDGS